eukprot:1877141-Alexandrium_andersonii.AAC.1
MAACGHLESPALSRGGCHSSGPQFLFTGGWAPNRWPPPTGASGAPEAPVRGFGGGGEPLMKSAGA